MKFKRMDVIYSYKMVGVDRRMLITAKLRDANAFDEPFNQLHIPLMHHLNPQAGTNSVSRSGIQVQ